MNVFDWLDNQLTSKQDRTLAMTGQQSQSNCTVSFTFIFHWLVNTSRIPSVRGWLKITIACAFDWLCNYFGFGFSTVIERFSNDCRKTKTKAITPTNHNRSRQRDEPITVPSNYL